MGWKVLVPSRAGTRVYGSLAECTSSKAAAGEMGLLLSKEWDTGRMASTLFILNASSQRQGDARYVRRGEGEEK